ncbi:unnamed protein product [Pleuronectes platessa]|uniref:Uncharacterized protein n=1 Tax=Pleuronectes platessa TaxID=8262 RepID=A0A9N7UJD9_PLEPL|nr:unnamed protein product [Pleuronectes platessa]
MNYWLFEEPEQRVTVLKSLLIEQSPHFKSMSPLLLRQKEDTVQTFPEEIHHHSLYSGQQMCWGVNTCQSVPWHGGHQVVNDEGVTFKRHVWAKPHPFCKTSFYLFSNIVPIFTHEGCIHPLIHQLTRFKDGKRPRQIIVAGDFSWSVGPLSK